MNKIKLLSKLKALYNTPEVKKGFPSQEACIDWSNKVAPLLKFDHQYYVNFIENAHKMNLRLSSVTLEPAFKIMVSQLQMAIEELQMGIDNDSPDPSQVQNNTLYVDESRINELTAVTNESSI